MPCLVDADCGVPVTWCEERRVCDTQLLECAAWPRCHNGPWLGCVEAAQRCIQVAPVPFIPTPANVPAGIVVAVVLAALLVAGGLLAYGLSLFWRWLGRPPGKQTHLGADSGVAAEVVLDTATTPKDAGTLPALLFAASVKSGYLRRHAAAWE